MSDSSIVVWRTVAVIIAYNRDAGQDSFDAARKWRR